jgi:glycosyltransferase involved in cell wall biosynthesis
VPGVSTDVGGVRDVVGGDELGLLAPAGNALALAERVLGLLKNPDQRRSMGARGRQSVVNRFGVNRLVDDVETLYRELAS